jgi:hypothetical protein
MTIVWRTGSPFLRQARIDEAQRAADQLVELIVVARFGERVRPACYSTGTIVHSRYHSLESNVWFVRSCISQYSLLVFFDRHRDTRIT